MGMKRFNTDRIRRRMKEQQGRFASKGKMLSMAPIRVLSPPPPPPPPRPHSLQKKMAENDKENPSQISMASKPPPLAISVTMSETEDDDHYQPAANQQDATNEIRALLHDIDVVLEENAESSSESSGDISAWAMMEHYTNAKDSHSKGSHKISYPDSKGDYQSFSTERSGIESSRIHWTEDENGELVQSSFYTQGDDTVSEQTGSAASNSLDASSTDNGTGSTAVHERRVSFDRNERVNAKEEDHEIAALHSTSRKVQRKWIEESDGAAGDDCSSPPNSFIQEPMIQSVYTASEQPEDKTGTGINDDGFSFTDVIFAQEADATQISLASFEASAHKSDSGWSTEQALAIASDSPMHNYSPALVKERLVYLARIDELEKSLRAQQNSTNEAQCVLKGKVEELEQALRVTAATPRGTIIQENPLKTLLDRNQTLVKEVRFADQTCVELSSRIKELETQNESLKSEKALLQKESANWQQQYDDLRAEVESLRNGQLVSGNRDAVIEELTTALELAKIDLQAKIIAEEHLLKLAKNTAEDMGLSFCQSSGASMSSTMCCNPEADEIERSSFMERSGAETSRSFHESTDALQQLVLKLMEKAKEIHQDSIQSNEEADSILQKNLFLKQKLENTESELHKSIENLEKERKRGGQLDIVLNRTIQAHEHYLVRLEKHLLDSRRTIPESIASDVTEHKVSFERDLAYFRGTLDAIRKEAVLWSPDSAFAKIDQIDCQGRDQLIQVLQSSMARMRSRYMILENDVCCLAERFEERVDHLAETITFLQKSLIFEPESVSLKEEDMASSRPPQHLGTTHDVIDSVIKDRNSTEDDDIFQMMEEARSPRSNDIEVLSDLDDMSRLLSDDMTLESAIRPGSALSSVTHGERWKEPLEAAIKECQRVRERCSTLNDQIHSQKAIIKRLEEENGRLSLNFSRRDEEVHLIEKALTEAKCEINTLQQTLAQMQSEKEAVDLQLSQRSKELSFAREANERLTKELVEEKEETEMFRCQVAEQDQKLDTAKKEIGISKSTCEEYKARNDELLDQLARKESEMSEKFESDLLEGRRSHRILEAQLSEERRLREELSTRLTFESNKKLELETTISELKNSEKQLLSDVEDRELASQLEKEDIRRERAELRSRLKEVEKESANLKETLNSLQEKHAAQVKENRLRAETLESQQDNLLTNIEGLRMARSRFSTLIQTIGCCKEDLYPLLCRQTEELGTSCDVGVSSALLELEVWKDLIPRIGDEISALHHTVTNLSDVEIEVENLKEQLSISESEKSEHLNQLEEERMQNEKLFSLLRQAEQEMERSTDQIQDMSESLSALRERDSKLTSRASGLEAELIQLKQSHELAQAKSSEERDRLKRALAEKTALAEEQSTEINEATSRVEQLRSELERTSFELRSKESELGKTKPVMESLEKKVSVLRDYVRKLTTKCEEWEKSYDRQSVAIDKLQQKNAKIREKASLMADKYRKLVADIQRRKRIHKDDRAKWSHERSSLSHVHLQLEQELEQIAKELSLSPQNAEH
jgi:hypothetical protein